MSNTMRMLKPKSLRTPEELEELDRIIREETKTNAPVVPVKIRHGGIIEPLTRSKRLKALELRKSAELKKVKKRITEAKNLFEIEPEEPKILAIVPAYEREADLDKTIISLLMQTRRIDQIVVLINGPGESDAAYQAVLPLIKEFRDQLIIEQPLELNGRFEDGSSRGSKVRALNWMYWRYMQLGDYDFVLGVDADIEADKNMVHHLEVDLIRRVKAAGVMARYSFKIPSDLRGKSLALIHGQRHEFAVTAIKQQIRGYKSEILGGQATLFRLEALRKAAAETDGGTPWDSESLVEDAQLTRTFQKLGYKNATSAKARAWTGLMYTPHAWQRQRRKWQDGHLTDIVRDFNPWVDRRRWFDQIALGWNLALRILFAVALTTTIALNKFEFHPIWLTPIVLAILQSVLVAAKIPNCTFREVMRAIFFIPGEIYYIRTLAVWLDSVLIATANIRRDGWGNQHKAEVARQRSAWSSWVLILTAITTPSAALFFVSRFLPADLMTHIIVFLWHTLTILTVGSTLAMAVFIFRMLRNYRMIAP